MDMQNVSNLVIPEGEVRTIHNEANQQLWGKVNYSVKYAGDAFQQTYSGKNLFNVNATPNLANTTATVDGQSITVTSNENASTARADYPVTYVANTTLTIGYDYEVLVNNTTLTTAHVYMRSGSNIILDTSFNLTVGNKGHKTITLSGGTADTTKRLWLYIKNSAVAGELSIKFSNIQLEYADSATSYEPYVGGTASPNPDYPQAVNVVTGTQTITISDGTNSQNYTVNLGSTELCKIGTYQDYIYRSGDDWYVHKEVGKYTFNGSEGWATLPYGTNSWQLGNIISIYNYNMYDIYLACDFSQGAPYSARSSGDSTKTCICYTDTANKLFVRNTTLTTQAQMQTATTGKNIYYVTTPIDTQITDSTLIGQLNAIHEWLTRYGYNATVSGNLPIIIDRTNL